MPVLVRLERQVILIMPYRIILCAVYFAINQAIACYYRLQI